MTDLYLLDSTGRPLRAPTHTLVVIGNIGCKRAYMDISIAEARRRYAADEGDTEFYPLNWITTFTFTDTFYVYDAWGGE